MVLLLVISLMLALITPKPTLADSEFTTKKDISYTLDGLGNAAVTENIGLTNNYSQIYPKEYTFKIFGSNIQDINGSDGLGNIISNTQTGDDGTDISLKFNQPSVGKDKTTQFKLNYNLPNIAQHKGNVWELFIPEYKNTSNDNLSITLDVPTNYGRLAFSSIPANNFSQLGEKSRLQFSSTDIKDKKILIIFGNYQLFDFNFKYYIKNPENSLIKTTIPLPPDTENQRIIIKSIDPKPNNVTVDEDGNWLAGYTLQANQSAQITLTGQVKIFPPVPQNSETNLKDLTSAQKYWPVDDESIKSIALGLKNPEDIYDYVVKTLNYNYDQINNAKRKGALEALISPQNSLCTEFTDLFVTLARADRIPSREIEGFAYTNNPKIKPTQTNTDILHAWPQYYDTIQKKWNQIDPTWGKTTNGIDYFHDLDLNHFTLVIHGKSSTDPAPPGSYKNDNTKSVNVDFATQEIKETYLSPKIEMVKTKFNQNPVIRISNPNFNALNNITVSYNNSKLYTVPTLPPFASANIDIPKLPFILSLFPKNQKINLKIDYIGSPESLNYPLEYLPHFLNLAIAIGIVITLLSIGGIILTVHKNQRI